MGISRDDFVKYPRTPHLFGSTGTTTTSISGEEESLRFIADESLIVEEKIDGTNVGIHFTPKGELVLQCRGHLDHRGNAPAVRPLQAVGRRETVGAGGACSEFAVSSCSANGCMPDTRSTTASFRTISLSSTFTTRTNEAFLSLERRTALLEDIGIQTVPVLHTGSLKRKQLDLS